MRWIALFDYLAARRGNIRLAGGLRKGYRLLVRGKAPCYEAVTL